MITVIETAYNKAGFKSFGVAAVLLLAALVLAGCASGDPAPAIERYIETRTAGDAETLVGYSCASWEGQAVVEATSFQSMNAEIFDMACQSAGETEGGTRVACTGTIVTEYRGEETEWDLAAQTFLAVQEGGEWRMCGYAGE